MPNWSPTNEELLAFVMNDADPKLKEKLEARLAAQPELQAELAEIAFIKSQLQSQAVLLSKPRSANDEAIILAPLSCPSCPIFAIIILGLLPFLSANLLDSSSAFLNVKLFSISIL